MKRLLLAAFCAGAAALALAAPAAAQSQLNAAATEQLIEVKSDFRGAAITIFGAAPDRVGGGDYVVTLQGPPQTLVVRRKRRILGLWINTDPVRFEEAPSFFALFATRRVDRIANAQQIWSLQLDPAASAVLASSTPQDADAALYRAALVRLMRRRGLYISQLQDLQQGPSGLFTAQVDLPANAPTGAYVWKAHYFRKGRLIGTQEGEVLVSKAGLERWISNAAANHPRLYGLAAVLMALGGGWLATVLFRRA